MTSVIQPWKISELSLADLINRGKVVNRDACGTVLRLAVLGDCATQHYTNCLSATLKLRGIWPEIYEAEYDSIRQETINRDGPLYAHAPKVIIFFNCLQKLEEQFKKSKDPQKFTSNTIDEITKNWNYALAGGAEIILQHNFCIPIFRAFGNFSVACEQSFVQIVSRLNEELARSARENGAVRIVDTDGQAAFFGKREWLDERFWCQAKQALSPRFLPPLVKSVSDVLAEQMGRSIKCVILDLDNTLWGGILADVGYEGIEIGDVSSLGLAFQRFQSALLQLKDRGVILAICSKNDEENVDRAFSEHPDMVLRTSDFVKIVANFEDKVTNIRAIQAALDISLDSMVFFDDSAFERDYVRTSLPELQVPDLPEDPADFLTAIAGWNLFETGGLSPEDRKRTEFYQANVQRQEQQAQSSDLPAYLRSLKMVADIRPFDRFTLPRALQLFQRSNQFNLTTIRYTEAELLSVAKNSEYDTFTVRLHDRLGDNGIIAAVITHRVGSDLHVDSWVMSCRVLGRRVEELTLDVVIEIARRRGCTRVIGEYHPTQKNKLVSELYTKLSFTLDRDEQNKKLFRLDIDDYSRPADLPIVAKYLQFEEV
jgi:FkbH-like protein